MPPFPTNALYKLMFTAQLCILIACAPLANVPDEPKPASTPDPKSPQAFIPHQIDAYQWLNDFVLADVNNDLLLDFASNNHGLRPRILLNTDNFTFALPQQSSPFSFNQLMRDLTPGFDIPKFEQPGLYLYYDGLWAKLSAKISTNR